MADIPSWLSNNARDFTAATEAGGAQGRAIGEIYANSVNQARAQAAESARQAAQLGMESQRLSAQKEQEAVQNEMQKKQMEQNFIKQQQQLSVSAEYRKMSLDLQQQKIQQAAQKSAQDFDVKKQQLRISQQRADAASVEKPRNMAAQGGIFRVTGDKVDTLVQPPDRSKVETDTSRHRLAADILMAQNKDNPTNSVESVLGQYDKQFPVATKTGTNPPPTTNKTAMKGYKIGATYKGGLKYLGGDPNDETSWKKPETTPESE
jgi:hypothetical protein